MTNGERENFERYVKAEADAVKRLKAVRKIAPPPRSVQLTIEGEQVPERKL